MVWPIYLVWTIVLGNQINCFSLHIKFDDYSGNLGSAALDPERIDRLPKKSGDARDFERDKASAKQAIRLVSLEQPAQSKASGPCQTYKV